MPKDLATLWIEVDGIARVPEDVAQRLARHRLKVGDIVYGRRGDIGRRARVMAHHDGWVCGTGCLRVCPDESQVSSWYLYYHLGQDDVAQSIVGRAHGATMPNLNAGLLATVPIVVPPRAISAQFDLQVAPIAEARENLSAVSRRLRAARDLLLPKLLSGDLSVDCIPDPAEVAT